MPHSIRFRTVLAAILAAAFVPVAFSQSQDSQSVAEAARRAREKKKDAAKPTKVITDENLDVKKGDVQSAVAEEPKIAGAPDTKAQTPSGSAANASTQASRDEKLKKEVEAVKQQLKEALSDLDLLQRENRLDQDEYYSKPNFASDTAGKQKLDDEQQQISNKRQEVERLKAKLAELQRSLS
jgi:acyl-CoA synthetase (AMP-forming)/AMP-acid ligase II